MDTLLVYKYISTIINCIREYIHTWNSKIWKIKANITSNAFRTIDTVVAFSNLHEITSPIWAIKLNTPINIRKIRSMGDSGRHKGENIKTATKHSMKPIEPNIVLITDQWIPGIILKVIS